LQTRLWNKAPLFGAALAIALALFSTAAAAAESSKDAVLAANAQFYTALNQMFVGELAPMEAVWSHAGDVAYMGPNGQFEHGWSAVLKTWQDQAALKLGGKVEPDEMQVIVGSDVAVVALYEVGENTNAKGKVEREAQSHQQLPQGRRHLEDGRPPYRYAALPGQLARKVLDPKLPPRAF
jgi:ketosteroid isomerase-like protein